MPAKNSTGGCSAAEVAAKLPKSVLVRRGHIREALGLSREEISALIPGVFKPVYPNLAPNKKAKGKPRAYFAREQVLGVVRRWEDGK